MTKPLLLSSVILTSLLLVSCGGGSSSSNTDGSGSSSGATGSSTGGSSGAGSSSGATGSSTGGSSGSTGGTNTGGSSSGGTNNPTTDLLLDRTRTYPTLGESITEHLRITETHQNQAQTIKYNLWDYLYSPTKINRTITFESYETNQFTNSDLYESLSSENIYEYSPRPPVETTNSRKLTSIDYNDGESSISGIVYDTKSALVFNNQNELVDIKIKKEPELIHAGLQEANRNFCSDDVPTGEIHFSVTGKGFWQLNDSSEIKMDVSGPAISCDSDDNASIAGHYNATTLSTDTLTDYHAVFSIRGHDFHNVLEFNNLQTTRSAGKIVFQSLAKTYLQYYTGLIAETEINCLGGAIGDSKAVCTTTDEVATNIPAIPEI